MNTSSKNKWGKDKNGTAFGIGTMFRFSVTGTTLEQTPVAVCIKSDSEGVVLNWMKSNRVSMGIPIERFTDKDFGLIVCEKEFWPASV